MRVSDIRREVQRAREAVLRILRGGSDHSANIALAIEALDSADRQLEQLVVAGRGRSRTPKSYRVEGRPPGESLAEYREGDPVPFRMPRDSYDALARVMPGLDGFVKYAEIADAVQKRLGEALPEYQIRAILRFWTERGAVEKQHTRYRITGTAKRWPKLAEQAWADARADD
jgi:hypothetical protein